MIIEEFNSAACSLRSDREIIVGHKTILIESVTNGWIVRPFSPCSNWAITECTQIAVYTKIEDLRKDLPRLLKSEPEEDLNEKETI